MSVPSPLGKIKSMTKGTPNGKGKLELVWHFTQDISQPECATRFMIPGTFIVQKLNDVRKQQLYFPRIILGNNILSFVAQHHNSSYIYLIFMSFNFFFIWRKGCDRELVLMEYSCMHECKQISY